MKFFALAAIVAGVSSISITKMDPLPEKPHQYNRVCDLVAPNNQGCEKGNPKDSLVQVKGEPLPEKPH
jgi:hypothetical protein